MAARYLTTPIYYVNDRPHIGHLYTTVVTDALARYWRLRGEDVRMLTGTDEHGQNIEKVAKKEGVAPIVIADRHAPTFQNLWQTFGIANDDFIRTTEPRHRKGVEEIIRRLDAAGDLYTASHEGWYCPPCEAFYPEKDLVGRQVPGPRHDARAAEGRERLLPPLEVRRPPPEALRRGRRRQAVRLPRVAPQRGALVRRRGPQGPLRLAHVHHVGPPVPRAARPRRLRLARRARELRHGARLRLGRHVALRALLAGHPRRSARTSCASTRSTGPRS